MISTIALEGGRSHPPFIFTKKWGEFPKAVPWAFDLWWVLLPTVPPIFPQVSNTISALGEKPRNCLGSHTGPASSGVPPAALFSSIFVPHQLCGALHPRWQKPPLGTGGVAFGGEGNKHSARGFCSQVANPCVQGQAASSSEAMANPTLPVVTHCGKAALPVAMVITFLHHL